MGAQAFPRVPYVLTFLLPIALLLGLTAFAPLLAHALRKGRARTLTFPAAHLIPSKTTSARKRNRIEDKGLLLLRILLLLCLALLAASPLVHCSRLSLSRTNGGSVAASLIIDDSASMRALTSSGKTRLESALDKARELLTTAKAGDAFSIVLAGAPARLLTPPTTEIGSIHEALKQIKESSRHTDLQGALALARSTQKGLPHQDNTIVLLSDLATEDLTLSLKNVFIPKGNLREHLHNCALINGTLNGETILVELVCTEAEAAKARFIQVFDQSGEAVSAPQAAKDGAHPIKLNSTKHKDGKKTGRNPRRALNLTVVLTPPPNKMHDQIPADDSCAVLDTTASLRVAVRADRDKAGRQTGTSTVLQAAIESLDRGVRVQPLSLLPDRASELASYGALFVDDPSGFTPETRDALSTWIYSGGVGVLFLGPGISHTPLGSDFAPFVSGTPAWVSNPSAGVDPKKQGSLGPLTSTWNNLGARHRAQLENEKGAAVKASWQDGHPLVVERTLGQGLLLTVTLPSSVDKSDLALRPAFLELVDYAISQSALRRGAQATPVGSRWLVDRSAVVRDPLGKLLAHRETASLAIEEEENGRVPQNYVESTNAGLHSISHPRDPKSVTEVRYAILNPQEQILQSQQSLKGETSLTEASTLTQVGISREIALLALVLSALELVFRMFRRRKLQISLIEART